MSGFGVEIKNYIVRKALESDSDNIAKVLMLSFEDTLSIFTKELDCFSKVFENGILTDRFFVADENGEIIGVVACTDCNTGRAMKTTKSKCIKHLGAIRGRIAFRFICSDLMAQLPYPETTSYIDVVGVMEKARGKGVAKEMLKTIIENNSQYDEFILEVDSINASAQKSYTDFGFVEFKRKQVFKFVKRYSIFMRYSV